ncbi:MAG: hypothetical protein Q9170_003623 [Blastenia crenularia]
MASSTATRPDPTADLHWSDYKGAIHDIFSENADRHPERLCVVETQSSKTPRREFTYKQIHHASNQVAHHLLDNGIERGDFVMIYAHRGVDLVVAVFGVLKAGATFSVIDPAYPPDRQIIYLDVAKPKALIIIEKASQEAGRISTQVRSYITENLNLKTEIPGLMLQDGGTLTGGRIDGQDVLAPQAHLVGKVLGIVIGPDDTPTLSFTSGSEGRPKGVKGRHFSLTYYFPWMAKTFSLSSDDKFTMLSGIAHDPIQRDMFTPLFLGAQLLVPSREDIQHELLAEWMNREGATVTHLTPAMGQILVGRASTVFPALHHAFFVGDILIKRDCRRLSKLAPNVAVVNMFGTTETQRAVSYFEIPSRNQDPTFLDKMTEVIPAGRGMYDVQLLVVNRENQRQCEIGETGDLWLRSGGLAESYLGEELADLTRTKFVENWFVEPRKWIEEDKKRVAQQKAQQPWRKYFQGPRDRLYRTGDLGRYMPSGDVIRGFRIELGEIDKWVSEHPLCQENATILRRDENEEPTLVTYIVPNMKKWSEWLDERGLLDDATDDDSMLGLLKRFRALYEDLRGYLKTKLASYAIPSVIIPLRRMPLNPNGKIDKPALPFPNVDELSAAAVREPRNGEDTELSATEQSLATIWAKTIPRVAVDSIRSEDSFFDLGGHSILAQYMLASVKKHWQGINLDIVTVVRHPTLRAFACEIDRSMDPVGLRLNAGDQVNGISDEQLYSTDASALEKELLDTYPTSNAPMSQTTTVFLTGATGFLGAYLVKEFLSRPQIKIIAHVRAPEEAAGFNRIKEVCQAFDIWSEDWPSRLSCVVGDLQKPKLGLNSEVWQKVADEADVVIHNGAKVHWVLPYPSLKPANILSTLSAMLLCATGKPKTFTFISSTSVLDMDHYVQMSENGTPVPESDDLEGSRKSLGTGYGQSKWVSEYLVREAGKRGLRGMIVRPGYVTGDAGSGVTNTDDFLTRYLKGCIQLHGHPVIENGINMLPVNHVARCVVACSLHPSSSTITTAHPKPPSRLTFTTFASVLQKYGYDVPQIGYKEWRDRLVEYVEGGASEATEEGVEVGEKSETKASQIKETTPETRTTAKLTTEEGEKKEDHALLPLYHFVTADLPSHTRAPELDDKNMQIALTSYLNSDLASMARTNEGQEKGAVGHAVDAVGGKKEEEYVTEDVVGRYIAYLVSIGFLPPPEGKGEMELDFPEGKEGVKGVGRGRS